jgi:uncharacterized membrane protein HdeD (DUF308 family)
MKYLSLRRWSMLLAGVIAILLGVAITMKPYDSLDTLVLIVAAGLILSGIGDVLRTEARSGADRIGGFIQMAAGVAVVAIPDISVRLVAIVVGVALLASGATRILSGMRRHADERFVPLVGGLAAIVAGVVALSWRDVTVLVVALLVGPVVVVVGIGQVVSVLWGRDNPLFARVGRLSLQDHTWLRRVGATFALIVALLLASVSGLIHRGAPGVDAFYDAPESLPVEPGRLLRSEEFIRALPGGTEALRILYTTTAPNGEIGTASALVLWSDSLPDGEHPVLAWAHGTTGVARKCAPSALDDPFSSGAMPALDIAIDRNWVIVATDYYGLGAEGTHPYLVGTPAAHSVLDAVRAARQLQEVALSDQTVVWGHSQGGGAALWTGVEASAYAPDVPIAGVAALAPASDLPAMAGGLTTNPGGALMSTYLVSGYSSVYDDVRAEDYYRSSALPIIEEVADRCLAEPAVLVSVGQILLDDPFLDQPLTDGPLMARLEENVPDDVTGIPTFIAQGLSDDLVLPEAQATFAERMCEDGQVIDYREYIGRDHVGVIADDSPMVPDLLAWTDARFAGETAPEQCNVPDA